VIDEASMINEELWSLLVMQVMDLLSPTQLLFVGDVAQLPPIGEPESQVFQSIPDRSDLTMVVRYGGAIALLAESIRNNLESAQLPQFTTDANGDRTEGVLWPIARNGKSCWFAPSERCLQGRPRLCARPGLHQPPGRCAQPHDSHGHLWAGGARFVAGERLVANGPCFAGDALLMQTSAECEVLDVGTSTYGPWQVWTLQVWTDEGHVRWLNVLHEASQAEYDKLLKLYAEEKRWQEFWDLKNLFANLNYAYCLTIHKSQGSTFQNVFVDIPNALINKNIRERNQLLYVAVTRASKRLFVC
jgi:exodeoxyribonuclease-5